MISKLLHDITQLGYDVRFCSDFEGMIRLELTEEYGDGTYYEHAHLGVPEGSPELLEAQIKDRLIRFIGSRKL